MPLPMPGDHIVPYAGVDNWFHGVICGLMPAIGVAALPKNIPVPIPAPMLSGISMPCLHFSASSNKSKQPVPIRGS